VVEPVIKREGGRGRKTPQEQSEEAPGKQAKKEGRKEGMHARKTWEDGKETRRAEVIKEAGRQGKVLLLLVGLLSFGAFAFAILQRRRRRRKTTVFFFWKLSAENA
jgi:hypothetical protein